MSKHTPAPWVAKGRYIGTPNHMSFIAECRDQNGNWSDEPMAIANARLIAAAPDLLDALFKVRSVLRDHEDIRMQSNSIPGELVLSDMCESVDAAIAKATEAA